MKINLSLLFYLLLMGLLSFHCTSNLPTSELSKETNPNDSLLTLWLHCYQVPIYGGETIDLGFLCQNSDTIKEENWKPLYNPIQGLEDFDWGSIYKVKVRKRINPKPMADASKITYELKEISEKHSVRDGTSFQVKIPIQLISATQDFFLIGNHQVFRLGKTISQKKFKQLLSEEMEGVYLFTFQFSSGKVILTQLDKI